MNANVRQRTMEIGSALRKLCSPEDLQNLNEGMLNQIFPSLDHKEDVLKQARSQEKGIPLEHQFGAICWWLGKCKHFQFIDTQPEFPYLSKIENVRYPDVFAIFNYNNQDFPCFIQIKSKNDVRLKMKSEYVSGLKKYPLLKGYPLLIAWKFREFWYLFDIDTFISENGGINVRFEDAALANLMGVLCGDFVIEGLKKGIEWCIVLEPEKDVDLMNFNNNMDFTGRCVDYYFFTPSRKASKSLENPPDEYANTLKDKNFNGESVASLMVELAPFLGSWMSIKRYENKYIYIGEKVEDRGGIFASQVLPFVSYAKAANTKNQKVNWEAILREQKFEYTLNDVRKMIEFGQTTNIGFERIIHFLPKISNPCID